MIGKNTIKLVKSLSSKKNRLKENLFLVEGEKNILEVLKSTFQVEKLVATTEFLTTHQNLAENSDSIVAATDQEIRSASLLQNPQNCFAICTLPPEIELPKKLNEGLSVYLDDIQDPGNFGTIIRICDWFGIRQLFCSPKTADTFNPKVIQASMGSFCRVETIRTNFDNLAEIAHNYGTTIYGAFLDGENIYTANLPQNALIVLGNEGNGIGKQLESLIDKKIKIPNFSNNQDHAESLNVSVATAIICSEFKRRN